MISYERKPIGRYFSMTISSKDSVNNLAEKFKVKNKPHFDYADVAEVMVWRCSNLCIAEGDTELRREQVLGHYIDSIDFSRHDLVVNLLSSINVKSLELGKYGLCLSNYLVRSLLCR
jgi:hypothetical protein